MYKEAPAKGQETSAKDIGYRPDRVSMFEAIKDTMRQAPQTYCSPEDREIRAAEPAVLRTLDLDCSNMRNAGSGEDVKGDIHGPLVCASKPSNPRGLWRSDDESDRS
jgi:hypothetical protein